jgi:hypothetical protein
VVGNADIGVIEMTLPDMLSLMSGNWSVRANTFGQ